MKSEPEYTDIIATFPYYCDDCESWHEEYLWIYTKGKRSTYSTCDTDGNHEHCTARDALQIMREEEKDWRKYNAWCAEHGTDPLGAFNVTREDKIDEKWSVVLSPWIGQERHGMKIVNVTGPEGTITPDKFPKHVAEWTQRKRVKGLWVCPDIKSNEDAKAANLARNGICWVAKDVLTRKTPRSKADIAAQIREIAGRK